MHDIVRRDPVAEEVAAASVLDDVLSATLQQMSQPIEEFYELGPTIGHGHNEIIVRSGINRVTGQRVAIKIVDKAVMKLFDLTDSMLVKEIHILQKVSHPNIIRLLEVYNTPRLLYIVMERAMGGDLFYHILTTKPDGYPEASARKIVASITDAIMYLHSKGIVHRDLKLENVLLASTQNDTVVRLCDFGLSKFFVDTDGVKEMKTVCGSPGYVAPEILRHQPYTEACDFWSIGVAMYIILCGYPPFEMDETDESIGEILAGKFTFHPHKWSNISLEAKDLISNLLKVDPSLRFNGSQIVAHPWMKMQ